MRKIIIKLLLLLVGIALGVGVCFAAYYYSGDAIFEAVLGKNKSAEAATVAADASSAEMTDYAVKILSYIKEGDYTSLSQVVHPEYGVVFSPYPTISLSSNKCFTAAQVAGLEQDENRYVWGKYDGSGEAIELTPAEYFKEFVFDKDYTLSPRIGVNTVVKTGNALENIEEVFPDLRFVDFHNPGTPASDGLDWSSLRLGFEEFNGRLMLTVIVHSQWTI